MLNEKVPVVDAHHDIAMDVAHRHERGEQGVLSRIWAPRLHAGGVNVQVLPLFVEDQFLPERGLQRLVELAEAVLSDIEQDDSQICIATTANEVRHALAHDKIAGVLALEGCDGINGDPAMLRVLYRLGVRMVSFTWNRCNEFAGGTYAKQNEGGLSTAGKIALQEMEDSNVVLDVSHLAETAFWDVAQLSRRPFVASHSNACAVRNHPRNLTDDQLRLLADKGGVVGLNFYGEFVDESDPTLDKLIDHLTHIVDQIGIDHVGIGCDFLDYSLRRLSKEAFADTDLDLATLDRWIPGCDAVEYLALFTERLLERGFSESEVELVMGANFMRVFDQVWA